MIYAIHGQTKDVRAVRVLIDAPNMLAAQCCAIDLHGDDFVLTGAFIETDWVPLQTIAVEPLPQGGLR